MRNNARAILALSLAAWPTAARADGASGAAARFLNIPVGARQTAMGQTGAAMPEDLYGVYYNPAGLTQLARDEAAFMHAQGVEGITYDYLAYAHPTGRYGTWAGDLALVNYGSIAGYSETNAPTGSVSASDLKLSLAWGDAPLRELLPKLQMGLTAKLVREKLDTYSSQAYAMDVGFRYPIAELPRYAVWTGLSERNLGTSMRFVSDSESLPRTTVLGVGFKGFQESVSADMDLDIPQFGDPSVGVGLELWTFNVLAWRVGYRSGTDMGSGLTGGIGFKFGQFQLDYAIASMGDFGYTQRAGLLFRFGGQIGNLYDRGLQLMSEHRYAEAIEVFTRVLTADPESRRAVLRLRECSQALSASMGSDKDK